jgi:hypothetical protein
MNPLASSKVATDLAVSEWDWRTTGTMPPPNGKCGSDVGDWSPAVASIYFTFKDIRNVDQSGVLNSMVADSKIRIQKATDSTTYSIWQLTGAPVQSIELTYVTYPVAFVESNGSPTTTTCTCVFEVTPTPPEPPDVLPPLEPPYTTGGPPFPEYPSDAGRSGLSILDWFAGHVATGLCKRENTGVDELKNTVAKDAYWIAALMVQVRNAITIDPTPAPVLPEEPTTIPPLPIVPPFDAGTYSTTVEARQQQPENAPQA